MSADPTPTPAAPAPTLRPSPDVVNALLKWPAEDRTALARLLLDSVDEGFTSLEEVEQRDQDALRQRIEEVVSGKAVLLDADEVLDELDRRYGREVQP